MRYFQQENYDMEELRKLADSPAGKKLIRMFMNQHADNLQSLSAQPTESDIIKLKEAVTSFLATQQARDILKQLGGNNGR